MREANPIRGTIPRHALRASAIAFLALAFSGLSAFNASLARADFLRRHPDASNLAASIHESLRLDPLNAGAHTLQAELLDQTGGNSFPAWSLANQLDPRNAEILVQLALHAGKRGDLPASEALLLRAARFNQTFFTRWSLVNYYSRHDDDENALAWAKRALARGHGDLRTVFTHLESNGQSPSDILRDVLPSSRNLMLAYLRYRVSQPDGNQVFEVSRELCQLIRVKPSGWPGLDLDPFANWIKRSFSASPKEEKALWAALDRLIALGKANQAVQLSNLLGSLDPGISPDRLVPWSEAQLVTNSTFRAKPSQSPLDWRLALSDSVSAQLWPDQGNATVLLSGNQPQAADLLTQVIRIPPHRSYLFEAQTQSGPTTLNPGFAWTFRDARSGKSLPLSIPVPHSADWAKQSLPIPASGEDRLWLLVLEYRRASGTVRREQELRIRSVSLTPTGSDSNAGEIHP